MTLRSLQYILQNSEPATIIAWDEHRPVTQPAMLEAVAQLADALQTHRAVRWLLAHDNSYAFAVGLLALLAAGKQVLLPPNAQPGTLAELALQADAFLGEGDTNLPQLPITTGIQTKDRCINAQTVTSALPLLDLDGLHITLLTSGSSGEARAIRKPLRALDAEVQALEALWGHRLGPDAVILSTVSHQHIYGLLFRLLWPLCTGRAFATYLHHYPESLLADAVQHPTVAIISSPSQLKRFPPTLDLYQASAHIAIVFSSGGPLPLQTAQVWHQQLRQTPVEVLGSTETGGVAWRCQTGEDAPWQPLPDVRTTTDSAQVLLVQSPFTGQHEPVAMGDRATLLPDGRFQLLGRTDRLVKIEEKRLSLVDMEQRLQTSPLAMEAHVIVLPDKPGRLGAVVILSPAGQLLLARQGKPAVTQQLKECLLSHFERILLPRKWRFPEHLPMNTQGKLPLAALTALFSNTTATSATATSTTTAAMPGYLLETLQQTHNCKQLRITLSADSPLFSGHFPVLPILPGVVQFDIAIRHCADWYPLTGFRRIEKLKFQEPIVPGDTVTLSLHNLGNHQVQFSYALDGRPLSSGRIVFVEYPPASNTQHL